MIFSLLKKIKIDRVRFSAQVFVVGMIISGTFFLLSIDLFKTYRSDISIIITPKSEIGIIQQKQLFSNVLELPKTLAFYDRVLKLNPDVRDVTIGLDKDGRKNAWNKMFAISKVNTDSSVLKLSIQVGRKSDSEQLASKTVATLFNNIAFYYDVKNDFNLSIIDGPIAKSEVPHWGILLFASISLGFVLAIVLSFIPWLGKAVDNEKQIKKNTDFFKKNPEITPEDELESLNNLYKNEQANEYFVLEEDIENEKMTHDNIDVVADYAERFQETKKITKQLEPAKYPNFPEMPIRKRVASAPDNLPIADDSFFAQHEKSVSENIAKVEQEIKKVKEAVIENKPKEPTTEELKKRLNELLRGER